MTNFKAIEIPTDCSLIGSNSELCELLKCKFATQSIICMRTSNEFNVCVCVGLSACECELSSLRKNMFSDTVSIIHYSP